MIAGKKPVLPVLCILSCIYFLLFIPPNLTGSKDPNMLVITGLEDLNGLGIYPSDEYAQYQCLLRMLRLGNTWQETVYNMLAYRHWQFGYPFFLISAIAVAPVKVLCNHMPGINCTTASMLILRQLSVLFTLISIWLLINMWTGFRYFMRSIALFIFLAAIPDIVGNNMWWHPDSLVTLFVVLTIFALYKDGLRFGAWFYGAACFCGLATGTKVIGLYLFLTIASYLLLGLANNKIKFSGLIRYGIIFLLIMAATVIITNPLLLISKFRKEIFYSLSFHKELNEFSGAFYQSSPAGILIKPVRWYTESLVPSFGFWWLYLIALCLCIASILYDPPKRLLTILIVTWILPFSLYLLFFVQNRSGRYFIPVVLPFLSVLGNVKIFNFNYQQASKKIIQLSGICGLILLCAVQLFYYTGTNINSYRHMVEKEKANPAIEFYHKLNDIYFSILPANKPVKILLQYFIYLPPNKNFFLTNLDFFGNMTHKAPELADPDLIIVDRADVEMLADPKVVDTTFDKEAAQSMQQFYSQAKNNSLKGYSLLLATERYLAFKKTS